jgi:hypothetical protein
MYRLMLLIDVDLEDAMNLSMGYVQNLMRNLIMMMVVVGVKEKRE